MAIECSFLFFSFFLLSFFFVVAKKVMVRHDVFLSFLSEIASPRSYDRSATYREAHIQQIYDGRQQTQQNPAIVPVAYSSPTRRERESTHTQVIRNQNTQCSSVNLGHNNQLLP
jgi:hypothetical protein